MSHETPQRPAATHQGGGGGLKASGDHAKRGLWRIPRLEVGGEGRGGEGATDGA